MIDIGPWLNQSVGIEPKSTPNGYGEASYGASVTHRCRMQRTWGLRRTQDGEVQVSDTVLYLLPTATVNVDDRATIDGQVYHVTEVSKMVDGAGVVNHYRVKLGRDA